jgi:hypothetical protein
MIKKLIAGFLYSTMAFAHAGYQIDLILFAHPLSGTVSKAVEGHPQTMPLSSDKTRPLIAMTPKSTKDYQLLSASLFYLRDQYYLINRTHKYTMLGHFSWRQPSKNIETISLPFINQQGWRIQGTIRLKKLNYYQFNADLKVSPPSNPQASLSLIQNQRLKQGLVYYLDNPQIGMVVSIHQIT